MKYHTKKKLVIKPGFIKESVQWVRSEDNLLTPRARMRILIRDKKDFYYLKYLDQNLVFHKKKKASLTQVYVNLFASDAIHLYRKNKRVATIKIEAQPQVKGKKTQLIDYSCSKYQIKIIGLDNEYVSVGCRLEKVGRWHDSKPRLKIIWSATNYELLDGTPSPFFGFLHETGSLEALVKDRNDRIRKIKIKAKLAKHIPRMFTAWGIGPYAFNASLSNDEENIDNGNRVAPALFLYGRYDLVGSSSFKFFDAFIANKAIFNNFGFYFSYLLAEVLDGRITIVPLLGAQALSFRIDKDHPFQHNAIFPQGFEISLDHAFGIENYKIVYGMFLSPSDTEEYANLWIRWGKGMFWELNYIKWGYAGVDAAMYGLSIGLPLATFF
ncbi:MAG: hypothetical protein ACPGJV_07055 [Bacteriovoracaceae bacterium]